MRVAIPSHFAIKMKCETEAAFQMAWAALPGARHNTLGANTEVPDRRIRRKWAHENKSFY